MERRRLLAGTASTFAISLVGCTDLRGDGASDGRLEHTKTGVRIVNVTTDEPPALPLSIGVDVVVERATDTRPVRIAITWENEADESVRIGEADAIVFAATRSENERTHLLAFDRIGDRRDDITFDGCWFGAGDLAFDVEYQTVDLGPGETYAAEPSLYASIAACLSGGWHRFETVVSVNPGEEQNEMTDAWGFSVEIEHE